MSTVKEIFEAKIPERITSNPQTAQKINAVYQFDITGNETGTWVVDLTKKENWVSAGPTTTAQCTITISAENFVNLYEKKLNPQMAFMSGKLKIKGDMSLALKLGQIIG